MSSVILITGASTGIGRLTAETLARAGHTVYASMRQLATRNAAAVAHYTQLAQAEQLALHTVELDVQDAESVERAVAAVWQQAGRIDAVVNNAGVMSIGISEAFTEQQFAAQLDINVMGPFRVSRAVLPYLRAQRSGLLIHVTSVLGRVVFPACGIYCASKFAHEALAESMHYELTGTGVESVIVEPGPYRSELLPNSPAPADQARVAEYTALAAFRETFVAQFLNFLHSSAAPNTQEVADAIRNLVELPPGQRPLRTVCGIDFGAVEVNAHAAGPQAELLRQYGMGHTAVAPGAASVKHATA